MTIHSPEAVKTITFEDVQNVVAEVLACDPSELTPATIVGRHVEAEGLDLLDLHFKIGVRLGVDVDRDELAQRMTAGLTVKHLLDLCNRSLLKAEDFPNLLSKTDGQGNEVYREEDEVVSKTFVASLGRLKDILNDVNARNIER